MFIFVDYLVTQFRLIIGFLSLWFRCFIKSAYHYRHTTKETAELTIDKLFNIRQTKKPEWVINEIIRLKAFMPTNGCRKIAMTFNRLHETKREMTVSKSFVYTTIIKHKHAIFLARKELKKKKPLRYPKNYLWSVDLTTVADEHKQLHSILGIVDAGTRANLLLNKIDNKSSMNLVHSMLLTIQKYGKPKNIRTDNEAIFTSRWFRCNMKLLGIKQQLTQIASPWQNGRIERLFGTLKQSIKKIVVKANDVDLRLAEFRFFYNHVRSHENLKGKTPAEAWSKRLPNSKKEPMAISLWQGLLSGYYWPE